MSTVQGLFVAQVVRYLSTVLSDLAHKLQSADNQNNQPDVIGFACRDNFARKFPLARIHQYFARSVFDDRAIAVSAWYPMHRAHVLYPLPQKHVVLKRRRQFSAVFQPRKIGAHRAAHQNILLKIHRKPVALEHFLQNPFKIGGRFADC